MIEPGDYVRKRFRIKAVPVTVENMVDLAAWCRGVVVEDTKPYIQIQIRHGKSRRHLQAFEGDWITFADGNCKVYTDSAFQACFRKSTEEHPYDDETADRLLKMVAEFHVIAAV